MSMREEMKMMRAAAKEACAEKKAALANGKKFSVDQLQACCKESLARLKQQTR